MIIRHIFAGRVHRMILAQILFWVCIIFPSTSAKKVQTLPFDPTILRGVNYVPSNRYNSLHQWADFDEDLIDREMRYAGKIGINFVRVFLHVLPFEEKNYDFSDLETFIRLAHKNNVPYVMPVIFDGCSDATIPEFAARCKNASYSPTMADAPVKCWLPNPGYVRQNEETEWGRLEKFVFELQKWFSDAATNDDGKTRQDRHYPTLWDLNNEPECAGAELNWKFVEHFLKKMRENERLLNDNFSTISTNKPVKIPITYGSGITTSLFQQKLTRRRIIWG